MVVSSTRVTVGWAVDLDPRFFCRSRRGQRCFEDKRNLTHDTPMGGDDDIVDLVLLPFRSLAFARLDVVGDSSFGKSTRELLPKTLADRPHFGASVTLVARASSGVKEGLAVDRAHLVELKLESIDGLLEQELFRKDDQSNLKGDQGVGTHVRLLLLFQRVLSLASDSEIVLELVDGDLQQSAILLEPLNLQSMRHRSFFSRT